MIKFVFVVLSWQCTVVVCQEHHDGRNYYGNGGGNGDDGDGDGRNGNGLDDDGGCEGRGGEW